MISARSVAAFFIRNSEPGTERSITPLKLQKLLYYAQGWHLALTDGNQLFSEHLEAWVHGPVCPELYKDFSEFNYHEINEVPYGVHEDIPHFEQLVLNFVWNHYGQYDGKQLEYRTHRELPWQNARIGLQPFESSNKVISTEDMTNYFSQFIDDNQN